MTWLYISSVLGGLVIAISLTDILYQLDHRLMLIQDSLIASMVLAFVIGCVTIA